jgi:hypothetical protein
MFSLCSIAGESVQASRQEGDMARIKQADHPTILRMVDAERRKVSDVAAEYGCTPAALYALLGKLRRRSGEGPQHSGTAQPPLALDPVEPLDVAGWPVSDWKDAAKAGAPNLAAGTAPAAGASDEPDSTASLPTAADVNILAFEPSEPPEGAGVPEGRQTSGTSKPQAGAESLRQRSGRGPGALGAKLAKPGCGLVMRTADGEESMTPFRSVEDLLSAIKPILRASAASSDPVWFSLQPVDLATIDVDAA